MMRSLILGTVAAALFSGTTIGKEVFKPLEADPEVINFGIISTESTQNLSNQWSPFLAAMEKRLGMKVKPFFAPDYAGVIEAMRFGKVTVAWFGNKSAMEAVDRSGAEIFAQQVKYDGVRGYYSHILAHVDDKDVNSLEDMFAQCGKGTADFGIGDPNSTSGFLVPTYYVFAENDIDPRECFKTVRNANHETNLMAVANKQVRFAANNSEQLGRTRKNAPKAAEKVKVIWTSPLIPSDPIVYRKDLSDELKDRIAAFFLAYGRIGDNVAAEREILNAIGDGLGPFHLSSNAQLYPIRQLARYKDKLKIESNDNIEEADKRKQIAAIDAVLAELQVLSNSPMGVQ